MQPASIPLPRTALGNGPCPTASLNPRKPKATESQQYFTPQLLPNCWRPPMQKIQLGAEQKAAFFQEFAALKCDSFFSACDAAAQPLSYLPSSQRQQRFPPPPTPQRRATAAEELSPASFLGARWLLSFPLTAKRCFPTAPTPVLHPPATSSAHRRVGG